MEREARIQQLLQRTLEFDCAPEVACVESRDLLAEVSQRWRQMKLCEAELNALFPDSQASLESSDGPSPPSQFELPRIPGYEVLDILGKGGMGIVYRAKHHGLGRVVALKMLLGGKYASKQDLERFLREARAVAGLQHPNIVQIFDVGDSDDRPFFTMEYVQGGSLAQVLGGVPLESRKAAETIRIIAGAAQAAHCAGIIHRDLKPANILFTSDGIPKVSDFGLAHHVSTGDQLTLSGARIGTPSYMAPEQAMGQVSAVGPVTDVYALGVIVYELLTGRPPFLAASAAETERQVISEEPAPPSRLSAGIPRDLETICLKCLQKSPVRRYASAALMSEDIGRYLNGEAILARPTSRSERALKWVKRHPALTTGLLATAVLLLMSLGDALWIVSARAATARAAEQDLAEAAQFQQQSNWTEAHAALDRAALRLGDGGNTDIRRQFDRLRKASVLASTIEAMRQPQDDVVYVRSEGEYVSAFRDAGIFSVDDDPKKASGEILASSVRTTVVDALDDWALFASEPRKAWLISVLDLVDPDPTGWRARALSAKTWRNRSDVGDLIRDASPKQPLPLLLATAQRLEMGNADCVPFLIQIQQAYPNDFWANSMLGGAMAVARKYPDAVRYYQAAIALRPNSRQTINSLGRALYASGRYDESVVQFRRAVVADPNDYMIKANLGLALSKAGHSAEAISVLDLAIKMKPDYSASHQFLAELLCAHGREAEAAENIQQCLKIDPKQRYLRAWLRAIQTQQGHADEVLSSWQKTISEDSNNPDVWDNYPEYCLLRGRTDEYSRACTELLRRFGDSKDPAICERIGRAVLLSPSSTPEQIQQATAEIDRAIAVARSTTNGRGFLPYYQFAKGLAEYRQGRFENAIKLLTGDASQVLGPAPLLVTAMAEVRSGQLTEARASLRSALGSFDWSKRREIQSDASDFWIYHCLRDEAESVISLKPVP